ncbi:NADH-ubiquinone oxidoreductase-F iron-sulfur binding region domain-containing protein [Planobispora siamensis]|uniref:Oxidoreductase n=1 Tax=Planobispora siamensis TaxID=936338 RepID=A0A8J3WRI2_9ACTN|nr:NADH-quinone oxidoreductase subunit NuoF family protein [Planobispora siamensis]GIH96901.1 oxidoreductase [Planobispora siamensis]
MIPYRVPPIKRLGPARLTAGLDETRRMNLSAHRAMHGTGPRMDAQELAELADSVDLRGRGGAAFPFARKVRAVSANRTEPVVLVNGAEGEPASSKDAMLLTRTPHLVIEGALIAAGALGARKVVVATAAGGLGEASVAAAIEERGAGDQVRVVGIKERFISGESSTLVRAVNGQGGGPSGRKTRTSDSGVDGRPTLLSNAETFAQLAVLATLGPESYADVGTAREPGTVLLTVGGAAGDPAVMEVATGTPLYAVMDACRATSGDGVLIGGYHGAWIHPDAAALATVSRQGIADAGGSLGAGIMVPLGNETCPLGETLRVARYLAAESSGQCGPCRLGLPDLARTMGDLVDGSAAALEELRRRAAAVRGRGACFHPDGTSKFVLSALTAFPDDVQEHLLRGTCGRPITGVLPLPEKEKEPEIRLTIDWTRCQGHGLCAKLAPDLVRLDEHGFPVFSREAVPPQLLRLARRSVEMCPALALRMG